MGGMAVVRPRSVETPKRARVSAVAKVGKAEKYALIWSPASGVTHGARCVATNILKHQSKRGDAWPSLDRLQSDSGLPRRRVVAAIRELEGATGPVRLTVVRRCRKDGPGRAPNVYLLTVDLSATAELCSSREGAGGRREARAEQSSTPELKSGREQSAAPELNSRGAATDLSSDLGGPEFQNGGDLSSDVGTGTYSGNLFKEPIHVGSKTSTSKTSKASKSPSRRKPETPIPDGFLPNAKVFEMASSELDFDGARVKGELAKFRDHAVEKDRRARDWNAAFSRWLRNARDWQKPNGRNGGAPRDVQRGEAPSAAKQKAVRDFVANQPSATSQKESQF